MWRWPEGGRMTETHSHKGNKKCTKVYCCVDWNQNSVVLSLSWIAQGDVICNKKVLWIININISATINSDLYGSLEVCMKMDLRHTSKFCLNMPLRVTKMAMVGSASLRLCYVTRVIYSESLPAHTTVLSINSKFLPTASYRLTYSIGTRRCKFLPELLNTYEAVRLFVQWTQTQTSNDTFFIYRIWFSEVVQRF